MSPRFITPLIILLIATSGLFVLLAKQAAFTSLLTSIHWLAPVTLLIAIGIASVFGHGRLVTLSAVAMLPSILPLFLTEAPEFTVGMYLNQTMLALTILMMMRERGVNLISIASFSSVFVVSFMIYALLIPIWHSSIEPPLQNTWHAVFQVYPQLTESFSLLEFCIVVICLTVALLRMLMRPHYVTIAIVFALTACIGLIIWPLEPSMLLVQFALAAAVLLAVLTDSFNMAFRDELTSLPSRRSLNQAVLALGRQYCVVMSDIDHFKKFNDTYGHDVGDQVLKLVASKLAKVEGGGKVFRYGGEEFTMLFPRKEVDQVVPFVEAIRSAIENYPIILRSKDRPSKPPKQKPKQTRTKAVKITCSFGIAEYTDDDPDFNSVMKRADEALYDAKKAGRNCVKKR